MTVLARLGVSQYRGRKREIRTLDAGYDSFFGFSGGSSRAGGVAHGSEQHGADRNGEV